MSQSVIVKNQSDLSDRLHSTAVMGNNSHPPEQQTANDKKPDHDDFLQTTGRIRWWDSVGISLFRSVFLVYCIITIIVTALSIIAEYNKTQESINFQLQRLKEGFEQTLVNSIWELDQTQIRAVLYGIRKNPIISGVSIHDIDGNVIGRVGDLPKAEIDRPLLSTFGLLQRLAAQANPTETSLSHYDFDLITSGAFPEKLGNVNFYWDKKVVIDEVRYEFLVLIMGAFVKTIALWMIFIYFQRPILSNHLAEFTRYIRSLNSENLKQCRIAITTKKFNEFNLLSNHLNSMVQKLSDAYEEIKQKNAQLVMEMDNRNRLEQAQREKKIAEAANRAKSQFLATMSHEIRTPMTGMSATVELLRRSKLDAQQRDYLNIIVTANRALLTIINDILDLSKIESGQTALVKESFNIIELLEETAALLSPQAGAKGLQLSLAVAEGVPSSLYGDPVRVRQILLNLMSNGVKFTQKGHISIKVNLLNSDHDSVELELLVEDSGIGIAAEDIAKLFKPFVQVDNSMSRKHNGTGLGLAICKRLVNMMNGEIDVVSTPGVGSLFRVTITLDRCRLPLENINKIENFNQQTELTNKLILLVEDEEVSQMVVAKLLESEGFLVTLATSGFQALEKIQQENVAVVLMDLRMPTMDGFATTKKIRQLNNPHQANTPIIAFTADIVNETVERCHKEGMNGIIQKPIDLAKLHEVIAKLY